MADTRISGLTAASALTGAEEFAVNQGGASKKATTTQISTRVAADMTTTATTMTPTMTGQGDAGAVKVREIMPGVIAAVGFIDVDANIGTGRVDTGMRLPAGTWPAAETIVAYQQYGGTGQYRFIFRTDGVIEFQQTTTAAAYEVVQAMWFV